MSDDVEAITGRFVGVAGLRFTATLVNHQIVVHHEDGGTDLHYSKDDARTFVQRRTWMRPA